MRRAMTLTMLLAMHGLSAGAVTAQEPEAATPQARVEASLAAFLGACRTGELATAARHVVYRGEDETREWHDTLDPDVPDELADVQEICQEVVEYDPENAGYAVRGFEMEEESEGVWHVLVVRYAGTGVDVLFAFLEIDGVFAIGDID